MYYTQINKYTYPSTIFLQTVTSGTHYKANNSNIELFVQVTIIDSYNLQKCI